MASAQFYLPAMHYAVIFLSTITFSNRENAKKGLALMFFIWKMETKSNFVSMYFLNSVALNQYYERVPIHILPEFIPKVDDDNPLMHATTKDVTI